MVASVTSPLLDVYGTCPPGFASSSHSVPSNTLLFDPPLSEVMVTMVPAGDVSVMSRSPQALWADIRGQAQRVEERLARDRDRDRGGDERGARRNRLGRGVGVARDAGSARAGVVADAASGAADVRRRAAVAVGARVRVVVREDAAWRSDCRSRPSTGCRRCS